MASFHSVAVIGGGAYGTALACAAVRAGRDVVLYARNAEGAARMQATRTNPKLPGVSIDAGIGITADIVAAARADIILLATPAQNLREAAEALAPFAPRSWTRYLISIEFCIQRERGGRL
jgi:glycerol-3-phosphate dehydrogenase (NAD(P)+)